MSNQLELVVQQSNLPTTEAEHLRSAFAPLFRQASEWAQKVSSLSVTDVSQTREMKLARESRLALRDIRCSSERVRKQLKEDSLRKGKAIDGMHNIIAYLTEPLEQKLLDMEQFAERKEQARLDERLKERTAALAYYEYTAIDAPTLRSLSDEAYDAILESARVRHEAIVAERARLEQEKLAKEKAEAEERERVRLENERLKAEAAKRDAELRAQREEQARVEAQHKAELEKQRKEREAAERKLKEQQAEKLRKEQEKLAAEREVRKKAERELAEQKHREEVARVEAEAKAKAEKDAAEAARKRAEFAPDKEKLELFLSQICLVAVPTMTSEIGQRAQHDLAAMKRQYEQAVKHYLGKL